MTWGKKAQAIKWAGTVVRTRLGLINRVITIAWDKKQLNLEYCFYKYVSSAIQVADFQINCFKLNFTVKSQTWLVRNLLWAIQPSYSRKPFYALPQYLTLTGIRTRKLNLCFPCCRHWQHHDGLALCSQCQVLSGLFQRAEQNEKKWKHLFLTTESLSCLWNGSPRCQGQHTQTDREGGFALLSWHSWLIVQSDTVPNLPKTQCASTHNALKK